MCFGPTVPDGYGVCYNPMDEHINIAITAFNSCEETNAAKFAQAVEDALLDMRALLEDAATAEHWSHTGAWHGVCVPPGWMRAGTEATVGVVGRMPRWHRCTMHWVCWNWGGDLLLKGRGKQYTAFVMRKRFSEMGILYFNILYYINFKITEFAECNSINIFFFVYMQLVPGAVLIMILSSLDWKIWILWFCWLFVSDQNNKHIGKKQNKKRNLAQVCFLLKKIDGNGC